MSTLTVNGNGSDQLSLVCQSHPWQPEDIALVFLTCPRPTAYFPTTLASALVGDERAARLREIVVAVDAPDLKCVEPLTIHHRIRWVPRTQEENARVEFFKVHRRACHNYWRALGLAQTGYRAVLVCEDDLVFRDGWLGMLLDSLEEMQNQKLEEFLLAAYSAYDHEAGPLRRGHFYSSYLADTFYGTQAMLYPPDEVGPVREIIWKHGVEKFEDPYDLLINRRARARQHLYTTRHSLMQHVGVNSTGLGDGRHRSPSFGRPWPTREKTEGVPQAQNGRIRVVTTVVHDASLLPHFIAYYRKLGVDTFTIAVRDGTGGLLEEVRKMASGLGSNIDLIPVTAERPRSQMTGEVVEELFLKLVRPQDWVIPADLDEFIEFPAPLAQLVTEMRQSGTGYVAGRLRDRISPDGSLTPTVPERTLWEQYPLVCDFGERVARGEQTKVALCQGDCVLSKGHHYVLNHKRRHTGRSAVVHHFKWRAGLLDELRNRAEAYRKERIPWAVESERVLAYFQEHKRIIPERFNGQIGWKPDEGKEPMRSGAQPWPKRSMFTLQEAKHRCHSQRLAQALSEYLPTDRPVYDFGCGLGYYVRHLLNSGFTAKGIEGTEGIASVGLTDQIMQYDLSLPLASDLAPGSAISIEVAEHIPKSGEGVFLGNVTRHCDEHLILSWALKGQGGLRHVNEQNADYVIPKLESLGFAYLPDPTTKFRKVAGQDFWWFKRSIYVFRRKAPLKAG